MENSRWTWTNQVQYMYNMRLAKDIILLHRANYANLTTYICERVRVYITRLTLHASREALFPRITNEVHNRAWQGNSREKERTAWLSDEWLPIAPWPSNEDACYVSLSLPRVAKLVFNNGRLVSCCSFSRKASERANYLGVYRLTDSSRADFLTWPVSMSLVPYFLSTCQLSFTFSHRIFCMYHEIPSETKSSECMKCFQ